MREQYGDASRLDARVAIYERFGSTAQSWQEWLLERMALAPGERVLDLGSGPGRLWRARRARAPDRLRLVLADLSPGMLVEARARLAGAALEARLIGARAEALPFAAGAFDVAIASHLLYHVPDRPAALAELKRALRPGGRLFVATNACDHLAELRELVERFELGEALLAIGRDPAFFALDAAEREVGALFGAVRVHRRSDVLRVTEAAPLLAYVRSLLPAGAREAELAALAAHVEREIARRGSLPVRVAAGAVEASR